jgi:hypothetical protein
LSLLTNRFLWIYLILIYILQTIKTWYYEKLFLWLKIPSYPFSALSFIMNSFGLFCYK